MKEIDNYELIPLSEISEEARRIAVLWVENYRPIGYDLPGKHKLASDIMNYANKEVSAYKVRLKDLIHDMKRTCLDNAEYLALERIEETIDTL